MSQSRIAINALIMDQRKAGIGNYAFHLLQEMNKLPHGLHIDVYIQKHMEPYFKAKENMRYLPCPDFKGSRDRIQYELFHLPLKYREYDYSVVHFLDYLSPIILKKSKKVVTIHDLSYFVFPEFFTIGSRLVKQLLTGPSIRSAARVICVSDYTRSEVQRIYQMADKLRVIRLGVESDELSRNEDKEHEILSKYKIKGSYIMHTGTLEPRKNTAALVRAYRRAVEKGSIPQNLVLCGKPGWKYEGIYQEIENSGLKDRIIITGYVSDDELAVLYSHADCFVYPSLYEGFGLPPLEAMSRGVPVICSNASSLPEVVENAALTFSPKDEEQLATHIIRVAKEPDLRRNMRQSSYRQAAKFTWRKTAEQTIGVYRELL